MAGIATAISIGLTAVGMGASFAQAGQQKKLQRRGAVKQICKAR